MSLHFYFENIRYQSPGVHKKKTILYIFFCLKSIIFEIFLYICSEIKNIITWKRLR